MDWDIFLQVTLPILAAFAWMFFRQERLFDKIEAIGNRLNHMEGEMNGVKQEIAGIKGMMQTIIAFLLGHKTGTSNL